MQSMMCGLAILLSGAHAQSVIPQISLENVTVVEAMEAISAAGHGSYLIRPGVEGKVTLREKNLMLYQAVKKVAAQANAVLYYRGGIFELARRGPQLVFEDTGAPIVPGVRLERVPIRDALNAIFAAGNASHVVDPEVKGTVTVKLSGQPMYVVLRNVLVQVDATYRVQNHVYQVVPKEIWASGPVAAKGSGDAKRAMRILGDLP